jgi:hypothetical protein
MLDLSYWVRLAAKLGRDNPTLLASLRDSRTKLIVSSKQNTGARMLKVSRKVALISCNLDPLKILSYSDQLLELNEAVMSYRRDLLQQSFGCIFDYFDSINRALSELDPIPILTSTCPESELTGRESGEAELSTDALQLNPKLLKCLVFISRDALKKLDSSLSAAEQEGGELGQRLMRTLQTYLSLVLLQIAKAGVTPADIARRQSSRRVSQMF